MVNSTPMGYRCQLTRRRPRARSAAASKSGPRLRVRPPANKNIARHGDRTIGDDTTFILFNASGDLAQHHSELQCKPHHDFEARLMKEFVVFYAWQSDTLERLNRHLIRFALNLTAKNISDDPTTHVRVRIDADTEDVLGHVPVTDTILKKIAVCDAFVPDLTFVALTEVGKLVPNPNVMLEYGYALRAKSHSVMIPVMNTAYGPAEKLPFDMAHLRHPLQYELPATATNAERRTARKALTEEFERILRLMIAEAPIQHTAPFQEAQSAASPAFFFPCGTSIATFGFPGEQEYYFEGDKAIYLRLF